MRTILRGVDGIRRNPLIQMVAVGTIALSLVVAGAFALVAHNVARLGESWGRGTQMTVYLADGVPAARARQIAAALGKLPGVERVRAVDAREAYTRLKQSLGERADLLDGVEEGFLPASVEATLQPGVAEVIRAHPAFDKLRHSAGVEDVELTGDWSARLHALQSLLRTAGLSVGLLVLCAFLYIVGSTIRLGVHSRRDEIEIQKLVGATDGFVRGPFLVEGALQGALGTAMAAGLLYGLYRLAEPRVSSVLAGLLASAPLGFFSVGMVALAVGGGALVGLCGSALALGRYVKV
jgi:cell division transport system permease protein